MTWHERFKPMYVKKNNSAIRLLSFLFQQRMVCWLLLVPTNGKLWKERNREIIPSDRLLGIYLHESIYFSKKIYLQYKNPHEEIFWDHELTVSSILSSDESGTGILNSSLGVIYELSRQQPMVKTIVSSPWIIPTIKRLKFNKKSFD